MANRREFLQSTIAVTALPLVSGGALAALAPGAEPGALRLYKAVFDERFPEARAFAEHMRRSGTRAEAIKGDITSLWFDDLHHRWSKDRAAVAGLTAPGALFCLERLAWDHKMRVVFLGEHRRTADGILHHTVTSPANPIKANDLTGAGTRWTERVASAVTRTDAQRIRSLGATQAGLPRTDNETSTVLFSWVIAPTNTRRSSAGLQA